MGKWGLTRQGVLDYAKTVQDGTALQIALSKGYALPGDEAAEAWKRALAALNSYLATLNRPMPTNISGSVRPSSILTDDEAAGYIAGDSGAIAAVEAHAASLAALAESELALAELLAAEAERAAAALGLPPLDTDGLSPNNFSFPEFDFSGTSLDSNFDSPSFGSTSAGMTINVNVAGNVQTEQDLAAAIRNQLLQGQVSGSGLFLTQAIV
jgi:hypothetical protein